MEESDEAIAECAECLVVQIAGGVVSVVERASSRALVNRAECPLIDRIVEPPVTHMSGEDGTFLARCDRQG